MIILALGQIVGWANSPSVHRTSILKGNRLRRGGNAKFLFIADRFQTRPRMGQMFIGIGNSERARPQRGRMENPHGIGYKYSIPSGFGWNFKFQKIEGRNCKSCPATCLFYSHEENQCSCFFAIPITSRSTSSKDFTISWTVSLYLRK